MDLVRIDSSYSVGVRLRLQDGSFYVVPAFVQISASGEAVPNAAAQLDTNGDIVPVWKAHSYTYDDSGNTKTDTVADGADTWVKTFTYVNGNVATDSGWVKQ